MDQLISFTWPRALNGYELADRKGYGKVLRPRWRPGPRPRAPEYKSYDPLNTGRDRKALFHIFADTEETPDGVLDFANAYGMLEGKDDEPLSLWYVKITSLRVGVEYWRKGDIDLLVDVYRNHSFGQISVHLTRHPGQDLPSLFFGPDTLLDALWIQFAEAICADLQINRCRWCSKPFAYGPGTGRRKTAIYCTPKCQKAHAYAKQQETGK